MRGLDPRIHRKKRFFQGMDCRVKPGNDDGWVSANAVGISKAEPRCPLVRQRARPHFAPTQSALHTAAMAESTKTKPSADGLAILGELEKKVLWLASWTIHHANHLRENVDGVKVGGHQASSASLATIMTALYFRALRPQDRVAVKPHASPIYHAIQYLLGRQSRQKLEDFRGYKGAQSYPSRTKDADDVDFSTGSVGLGVAQTLFSSLVQDYVRAHGWGLQRPEGRMIALVGDAELDEGNIFEAILEGWKQGLRNCWWIIDYNRQSLDAVIREGLWARFEALFRDFGWDVVILKYGLLLEAAFREPGGEKLRQWIDNCPNQLYSALVFQGGAAWRRRLLDEIGDQGAVTRLIEARADAELGRLMTNLAGHDLPTLIEAFGKVDHDRPISDRRPRRRHPADRGALGRGARAADDQPRGSRPPLADRSLRQGRSRPADLRSATKATSPG